MKYEVTLVLWIVFLLWLMTWLVGHSYIVLPFAPVMAILGFVVLLLVVYFRYRIRGKA